MHKNTQSKISDLKTWTNKTYFKWPLHNIIAQYYYWYHVNTEKLNIIVVGIITISYTTQ